MICFDNLLSCILHSPKEITKKRATLCNSAWKPSAQGTLRHVVQFQIPKGHQRLFISITSRSETANLIAHRGWAHQGAKQGRHRIYGVPILSYFIFNPTKYPQSQCWGPQGLEQHAFTVRMMSFPRGQLVLEGAKRLVIAMVYGLQKDHGT